MNARHAKNATNDSLEITIIGQTSTGPESVPLRRATWQRKGSAGVAMVDMNRRGILQDRPGRGGDMRIGAIIAAPSMLAKRGLDPVRVFATVGLDPCLLDDPENRI